jgi:subtilisin family serine protease
MSRAPFFLLLAVVGCTGTVETASPKDDAGPLREASMPANDASKPIRDASNAARDARAAPDALIFSGTLPECHWPASLDPGAPDGDTVGWYVNRTTLACGGYVTGSGTSEACGSDSGTTCGLPGADPPPQPCMMGCEPNQYAVSTIKWFGTGPGTGTVIRPVLPAGCGATLTAFSEALNSIGYAEPLPTISCCPCE